ncbi:MAG: hypothetical protein SCK29_10370 [Bacillota bacterium]|nr:hypothetical protein [Bacillota bacterium]MDW7684506.1 hypothetical protein [Bacillota bacterium]
MKWLKLILYLFGLYYLVAGLAALFVPKLCFSLYGVASVSPSASMTARWLGAMAIAVGFGAFTYVKKPVYQVRQILVISVFANLTGSLLGAFSGEISFSYLWLDTFFNVALILALISYGHRYEFTM